MFIKFGHHTQSISLCVIYLFLFFFSTHFQSSVPVLPLLTVIHSCPQQHKRNPVKLQPSSFDRLWIFPEDFMRLSASI